MYPVLYGFVLQTVTKTVTKTISILGSGYRDLHFESVVIFSGELVSCIAKKENKANKPI
jgi:hypothetical protein